MSADFFGFLGEYLSGTEDLCTSRATVYPLYRCAILMRSWLRASMRAGVAAYMIIASTLGLFAFGTAIAFVLIALLFNQGAITLGTGFLIFRYTELLRQPTERVRDELQDLQKADASITRIEELLVTASQLPADGETPLPSGDLAVEFDAVSFAYGGGAPILHNITLHLEAGKVLGIIGHTGSGKTTMMRLLMRFYDPFSGTVRLGGVDLKAARLAEVRARVGLVTQEVQLFHASVRDNVTVFDDSISDMRITAVLEDIGLGAWYQALSSGLDTAIAPGSAGLSAGEAQLLACARVFLQEPDVVVLDEASSRLDPATERLVQRAFGHLLGRDEPSDDAEQPDTDRVSDLGRGQLRRTGIIVAHRLSTIRYADDILILKDGRVCEQGARLDLAADPSSRFAHLLQVGTEMGLT